MSAGPSVFISYSWDSDDHRLWVRALAERLRQDGMTVRLDQWFIRPGDDIPAFMEVAVRESEFVIIVCTPTFKAASDNRTGGVGYESQVLTGEVFALSHGQKVIPILRDGTWAESAPSYALGRWYVDMRGEGIAEIGYALLSRTLFGRFTGTDITAPLATAVEVGQPNRRPVIIAHFLDHYVLELSGYGISGPSLDRQVATEAALAFRVALLAADQVLVPAVSFFQSPLCRRIIMRFRPIFDLGFIKLTGDAYDWREFRRNRLQEYARGSRQYDIYDGLRRIKGPLPALAGIDHNTTEALHDEWRDFASSSAITPRRAANLAHSRTGIWSEPTNIDLADVAEILGPTAFVGENIYPILFSRRDPVLLGRLSALVCSMFFRVMSRDHRATLMEDLTYIRSMRHAADTMVLSYRSFLRALRLDDELWQEVRRCEPLDLLRLQLDPRIGAICQDSYRVNE
jgi:hypothetical protein